MKTNHLQITILLLITSIIVFQEYQQHQQKNSILKPLTKGLDIGSQCYAKDIKSNLTKIVIGANGYPQFKPISEKAQKVHSYFASTQKIDNQLIDTLRELVEKRSYNFKSIIAPLKQPLKNLRTIDDPLILGALQKNYTKHLDAQLIYEYFAKIGNPISCGINQQLLGITPPIIQQGKPFELAILLGYLHPPPNEYIYIDNELKKMKSRRTLYTNTPQTLGKQTFIVKATRQVDNKLDSIIKPFHYYVID